VRVIVRLAGFLVTVIAVAGGFFLISMRLKLRPVHEVLWKTQRSFLNPRAMRDAGQPGAYASIVRHTGRTSGKEYETPVGVVQHGDEFVVALPYGTSPDWFKNVMTAGSAVLVTEGATYEVDRPELVSSEIGNAYFDPKEQRIHRIFGVDEFLVLHTAEPA